MWGGSNGANSVQIFAANAGAKMPIAAISAGWGQLMAAPPRSGPALSAVGETAILLHPPSPLQ